MHGALLNVVQHPIARGLSLLTVVVQKAIANCLLDAKNEDPVASVLACKLPGPLAGLRVATEQTQLLMMYNERVPTLRERTSLCVPKTYQCTTPNASSMKGHVQTDPTNYIRVRFNVGAEAAEPKVCQSESVTVPNVFWERRV